MRPACLQTPRKMELLRLLFLLPFLSAALSSCDPSQPHLLSLAFTSVSGFRLPLLPDCGGCLRDLRLPSQNLSGTVSWMFLRNITTLETVDLSGNSLEGSIPGGFWSAPALAAVNLAGNLLGGHLRFDRLAVRSSLRALNLSGNRFTGATGLSWHDGLQVLDLSGNSIALVPMGLRSLVLLQYLDLSGNFMAGEFPGDFPAIAGLRHLNLSSNNLTGTVDSESLNKFGVSAFVNTGSNLSFAEASFAQKQGKKNKHSKALIVILSAAALIASAITGVLWFLLRRKKWEKVSKKTAAVVAKVEWVAEARWEAPVVVFQKPLMELTFADMVEATSGFGRESLLAEGWRRGPLYRAVLPGEMNVVVRVLDSAAPTEETAAAAAFREIGRLRHPNLLPLLGYCICGRKILLLYEYMERGDLRRWLHELPAGRPDGDDWTDDIWDDIPTSSSAGEPPVTRPPAPSSSAFPDWPTRHRIALGVARGLAFLHQGWSGSHTSVVHGHLAPSNILLTDDLEPRIADFWSAQMAAVAGGICSSTVEDDVYSYGVVVMELVTGRIRLPDEVQRVRAMVRDGRVDAAIDRGLQIDDEWEKEAAECLRVAYLCTARSPEKRPAMRQVVALLKDIRPPASASVSL